jgi:hypothetical protein
MTHHCHDCATRPRANLTLHQNTRWRPECLYAVAERQVQHQTLVPPSTTRRAGFTVLEGGKERPPRRRATVTRLPR